MKLLIVEDEPLLQQRLQRLCSEIIGPALATVAVASLSEAREQLLDRAFDGLLLDLNLAGHDGFGLLRRTTVLLDTLGRVLRVPVERFLNLPRGLAPMRGQLGFQGLGHL